MPIDQSTLNGIISLIGGVNSLANTGGSVYGSLLTKDLVDQILGGKVNVLNNLNGIQNGASNNIQSLQGPLTGANSALADRSLQNFLNGQGGLGSYVNEGLMGLGGFGSMADPNAIPGMSDFMNEANGLISHGNQMGNVSAAFGAGQTGGQAPLLQAGSGLLSGSTQNDAFQQLLQSIASKSLGNGGYTQQLNTVNQEGQNLLQQNPLAAQASGLASSIFGNGQPVLPMDQAVSLAKNQNAAMSNDQMDNLRRQLLNRTGVTGPAVASGSQNELLNNLGDQALQNQSSAVTNTILGQQGLNLQQTGLGNALLGGATGANLGYTGQGLNAMLQSAAQSGQLMSILGNLGLGGGSLGLNTLSTGGNLLNSFNQSALQGLGADQGYLNSLGGLNNNILSAAFGTQNLNQQQLNNKYGALSSMLGAGNQQSNQALNAFLGSQGQNSQILQDYISQLTQGGTSQVGLYSQTPQYPANFMQNLLSGGGGALNSGSGLNFGFNFGGGGNTPSFNFGDPFGLGGDPFGGLNFGLGGGNFGFGFGGGGNNGSDSFGRDFGNGTGQ